MSANKEAYPGIVETFVRPDMPVTLWRCVWVVLFWLAYGASCVLTGYYASSGGTQASRSDAASSHYHLSDAHYL
ncbi:hypothetical protein GA0061070_10632 [Kosakonia oryziphila]|uniref:Uncharacterized protein n=1 Tax=Kosakonia oryziphila TaxID=1005667 RepID=A0A1C4GDR0_9ENTR|nr:hypothetical protein GA0061070_10632 [Kosakonia oryziphila]